MTCASRIQGARCNGSLVPRTRGSNVPSTPPPRRPTIKQPPVITMTGDANSGERKRKPSRCAALGLAERAFLHNLQPSETSKETPVACNTGVTTHPQNRLLASQGQQKRTMKRITKHVDYLGMTYPGGTQPDETGLRLDWRRLERAFKGYQFAMVNDDTGAVWLYNIGQSNMGAHLQLSGNALSQLRLNLNVDDFALIRQLTDFQGRASRIDLAINFHDTKMTALRVYDAFKADEIKTPARSSSYIEGVQDGIQGMTCYVGVRQSERLVRVYDKNAEQKNRQKNPEAWVRMEMEMKKLWARAAQNSIVQFGTEAAINSHFTDFMAWNNQEYNGALKGESAPIDEIGRKDSSTEKWLMKQVAPALAKACIANSSLLAAFLAEYRRLRAEIERRDRGQATDNAIDT